jgi:hypothetical protein
MIAWHISQSLSIPHDQDKNNLPVLQYLYEHACGVQVTCTADLKVHETATDVELSAKNKMILG